ncbi:hypothetical protein [Pandoravirus japonicus]|uniref:Transmembrane protein n=1 Tax=Pandoravirus japonicus TaxID=2823154 RepID=A0A811BPM3_9VIRU|nr:hypothetical protein [Pandoravirus japonicus]
MMRAQKANHLRLFFLFFYRVANLAPKPRPQARPQEKKNKAAGLGVCLFFFVLFFSLGAFSARLSIDEKRVCGRDLASARRGQRPRSGRAPKGRRARARSQSRARCALLFLLPRGLSDFFVLSAFRGKKEEKGFGQSKKKKKRKQRVQSRAPWLRPTLRDPTKADGHRGKAAHASPSASIDRAQVIPFSRLLQRFGSPFILFVFSVQYLLGRARTNPHVRSQTGANRKGTTIERYPRRAGTHRREGSVHTESTKRTAKKKREEH